MEGVVPMETTVKVSRRFAEAFALVHEAFGSSPSEIAEAKMHARTNRVAAEDGYYASAEMIRAGWNPLKEQAAAFVARTGFEAQPRWPVVPAERVDLIVPLRQVKKAA